MHLQQHLGAHFRSKGAGTLAVTAYNFDNITSFGPTNFTLSTTPGDDLFMPLDLLGEGVCYDLSHNAADAHVILSYLRHYSEPWAMLAS